VRILGVRYLRVGIVTVQLLLPVHWLFTISFKTPDEIYHVPLL
jgi:multiple sugar transport system permease protein